MGGYTVLSVLAVTMQIAFFTPIPLDDLTINLNLNKSPKNIGYEEDIMDVNGNATTGDDISDTNDIGYEEDIMDVNGNATTGDDISDTSESSPTIDEIIAPNSYNAQVEAFPLNNYLRTWTKKFDSIRPQMVFNGLDIEAPPRIVNWTELRANHKQGGFHHFVEKNLDFVFRHAERLVIVTHGWKDGNIKKCKETWVTKLAQKIGKHEHDIGGPKTATLALCWNSSPLPSLPWATNEGVMCETSYISPPLRFVYYDNACTTGKVGELLAKLITAIKDVYPNVKYVHGIGHSLGAHVMGNIFNFGRVKIDRISGLDPAGPCFEKSGYDIHIVGGLGWGVHEDSADFVDNIHTDGRFYGTYLSKGHIDIFAGNPNKNDSGAGTQPTCRTFGCAFGCCHTLAPKYYNLSIGSLEFPKFKTSYMTQSQNEDTKAGRSIGFPDHLHRIYAGYHCQSPVQGYRGRMFLPIFNVNGVWHPICDIEYIPMEQDHWCNNAE